MNLLQIFTLLGALGMFRTSESCRRQTSRFPFGYDFLPTEKSLNRSWYHFYHSIVFSYYRHGGQFR